MQGSINYRFDQYIMEFAEGKEDLLEKDKIADYIQSLKSGWKEPIEVVVALDISKHVGLIVDGTHRSLALYYLYITEGKLQQKFFTQNAPISICIIESKECRNLFHSDFQKLIS